MGDILSNSRAFAVTFTKQSTGDAVSARQSYDPIFRDKNRGIIDGQAIQDSIFGRPGVSGSQTNTMRTLGANDFLGRKAVG